MNSDFKKERKWQNPTSKLRQGSHYSPLLSCKTAPIVGFLFVFGVLRLFHISMWNTLPAFRVQLSCTAYRCFLDQAGVPCKFRLQPSSKAFSGQQVLPSQSHPDSSSSRTFYRDWWRPCSASCSMVLQFYLSLVFPHLSGSPAWFGGTVPREAFLQHRKI